MSRQDGISARGDYPCQNWQITNPSKNDKTLFRDAYRSVLTSSSSRNWRYSGLVILLFVIVSLEDMMCDIRCLVLMDWRMTNNHQLAREFIHQGLLLLPTFQLSRLWEPFGREFIWFIYSNNQKEEAQYYLAQPIINLLFVSEMSGFFICQNNKWAGLITRTRAERRHNVNDALSKEWHILKFHCCY